MIRFKKLPKILCAEIGKRTGDVVVITGGARGIGVEVIKKLLQCHFHVVMGRVKGDFKATFIIFYNLFDF